jgi:predicted enzyme related to lactoylglutathione lyase
MPDAGPRLAGVELYFDDLEQAKRFYGSTLGLWLEEEQGGHHVKFALGPGFLCAERKGVEDFPSADKAVVFIEVADLRRTVASIGSQGLVRSELHAPRPWAAVRDPEGHTVLLLQASDGRP